MANVTLLLLLLIMAIVLMSIVLGPAYLICRSKIRFIPYSGLPLGSLIPWILCFVPVAGSIGFVPEIKQQGYAAAPVLLMFGGAFSFIVTAHLGAFKYLEQPTFFARARTGAKLSAVFAVAVTMYIFYLGFVQ